MVNKKNYAWGIGDYIVTFFSGGAFGATKLITDSVNTVSNNKTNRNISAISSEERQNLEGLNYNTNIADSDAEMSLLLSILEAKNKKQNQSLIITLLIIAVFVFLGYMLLRKKNKI